MKQRVAIARAFALEPALLLMDEPFAALDALTRRQMQDELLRLCEETGSTTLFVTHGIDEAIRVGTRILALTPHPGRLAATFDVPLESRARGTASFAELELRIQQEVFGRSGDRPCLTSQLQNWFAHRRCGASWRLHLGACGHTCRFCLRLGTLCALARQRASTAHRRCDDVGTTVGDSVGRITRSHIDVVTGPDHRLRPGGCHRRGTYRPRRLIALGQ